MSFAEFLERHRARLADVHDVSTGARWHRDFAAEWAAGAIGLAEDANRRFGLQGDHRVVDEVGYLVAEGDAHAGAGSKRLVLLSANPGWSAETSKRERLLKGQGANGSFSVEDYESFRTAFFPRWYEEVIRPIGPSRGSWWGRALRFLHAVADLEKPTGMASINPALSVLGWELWPFHSRRDGLSSASEFHDELDAFATASIEAACRVPSDGVFVTSKAGFERVARLPADRFAVELETEVDSIRLLRVRSLESGRAVWAISRQLFAGWCPRRETMDLVVTTIRGGQPLTAAGPPPRAPLPAGSVARPPAGELHLCPDQGRGPLLILVGVGGGDLHDLVPLEGNEAPEEVHERVGGYWIISTKEEGRGGSVRRALVAGRRVFVVGFHRRRVVRALEVVPAEDFSMPKRIDDQGSVLLRLRKQPRWTEWPDSRSKRWATVYGGNVGGKRRTRVRYHTRDVQDEDWIGRQLLADPEVNWRKPILYATTAPPPDREEE